MKMVHLNGLLMAPHSAYRGTECGDYAFVKGALIFDFALKGNDVITVTKTFLGIIFSRKFYGVVYRIRKDTPLQLHKNGTADADGVLKTEEGLRAV